MAKCMFCGQKVEKKQPCQYCGEKVGAIEGTGVSANGKGSDVTMHITTRYLVFDSKPYSNADSFISIILYQVLGALIGLIVDIFSSFLNKDRFGFVDNADIYTVVVENTNNNVFALKVVLRNGTEIIIKDISSKGRDKLYQAFYSAGIPVVLGGAEYMVYTNPYIANIQDLRNTVCASAAGFVNLHKKQKVLPPVQNIFYS